jgi:hypothetical protein
MVPTARLRSIWNDRTGRAPRVGHTPGRDRPDPYGGGILAADGTGPASCRWTDAKGPAGRPDDGRHDDHTGTGIMAKPTRTTGRPQ